MSEAYREALRLVEALDPEEQDLMRRRLNEILLPRRPVQARADIMELRGLGKEIWEGVDAQAYVDEERRSWDR